jgi:hypothetical protein
MCGYGFSPHPSFWRSSTPLNALPFGSLVASGLSMRREVYRATRDLFVDRSEPGLRDFVRDYLIAHFRFDPGKPIPHKRYAPKPEQGITFFVRGRPRIVDPLTTRSRSASRGHLRAADEAL